MNHSIITEYQEEHLQYSPTIISCSKLSKSPESKKDDFYISKLESKVKQLKNSIRKNKPLIQQVKAQRKFMKKICQKQKQKIEDTKIDVMKQDYENQIELLRHERHKLQDIISVTHQQSNGKAREYVEAKQQINQNYMQFVRALEEVKNENRMYEDMLLSKTQAIETKSMQIKEIEQQIRSKLNVQKKYKEVMQQIQLIESQKKSKLSV